MPWQYARTNEMMVNYGFSRKILKDYMKDNKVFADAFSNLSN